VFVLYILNKSGGNMEKNTGLLVGCLVFLAVLNLVGFFVLGSHNVDEQALADKVTAQVIKNLPEAPAMPTAAEIAAQIVVPEAPSAPAVTAPEFTENEKVNDLWENLYSDQIDELETEAYNVAVSELEKKDFKFLENFLEGSIVGFDELKSVSHYELDDCDVNVVNLGLDEDEDKVATVNCDLKVKYSLLEGTDNDFKKTVELEATVTFDQGDFEDEDVELVFA
jgi:hypothetical protein